MRASAPACWRVVAEPQGLGTGFRWGKAGDEYVAEWRDVLTVRANSSGEATAWEPASGATPELVAKTRHGVAAAFLRALRGGHSLHASAVVINGAAVALIGASGVGKSTIGRALCEVAGVALLADDAAGLETEGTRWLIAPSEPALWVADEKGARKARFSPALAAAPAPVRLIARLSFDEGRDGPVATTLHGAAAASALVSAMMRFEAKPELWKREFDLVGSLVRQVQLIELTRPLNADPRGVAQLILDAHAGRHT